MVLRNMRRHVLKNMADVMIGDLVEDLLALAIALDETRPAQQAQMTSVLDLNVHCLAVKGTFDDCQDIVKALFSHRSLPRMHAKSVPR